MATPTIDTVLDTPLENADQRVKLPIKEKLGYGLGMFSTEAFYNIISVYLLYFFTDVLGIAAAAGGLVFIVVRVWDTIIDPPIGAIVDRTQTRWGKFRPYILFGALPLAGFTVLCFTVPNLSGVWKLVYVYVVYIAFSTAYSLVAIPYSSLTAAMTQDFEERSSVSAYRMIFAMFGSLFAAMSIRPMVDYFAQSSSEQTGFLLAVSIFAVICFVFYMICFASVKERASAETEEQHTIRQLLQPVFQNKPLMFLIVASFFNYGAFTFRLASLVYFFEYYVQNMALYVPTLLAAYGAVIVCMLLVPYFARRFEKKVVFIGGLVIATLGSLALWFVPPDNAPLLILFAAVSTFGGGAPTVMFISMLADCVEYGEWKTGVRATGAVNSAYSFTNNIALALAGGFLGLYLSWIGYVPNVAQSQTALTGIRATQSLLLIVMNLLSILVVAFYPINSVLYGKIVEEIKARKMTSVSGV